MGDVMNAPRMQVSAEFARIQSPELVAKTNSWMRDFFGVEGKHGYEEGSDCCRNHCAGIIDTRRADNCSCHLSAPCSACTAPRNFCPDCGWEEADDEEVYQTTINDYVVKVERSTGVYKSWEPRPLDPTRIDWRWASHSNASMIKEGIYPEGTTTEELVEAIQGTFGGRFEYHSRPQDGKPGRFKYIAYTD
jgi:hypothetical protein